MELHEIEGSNLASKLSMGGDLEGEMCRKGFNFPESPFLFNDCCSNCILIDFIEDVIIAGIIFLATGVSTTHFSN